MSRAVKNNKVTWSKWSTLLATWLQRILKTIDRTISFPEHARSRVSGGHSSGETNVSRTISYGWRMLLDDYHQIAIHIKCGPTRDLIMLHRNLLKSYEIIYTSEVAKIGKVFTKRIYLFDSVSMERLKSAAQSALTKRKLKHCVKERGDGMPTGYGKSL